MTDKYTEHTQQQSSRMPSTGAEYDFLERLATDKECLQLIDDLLSSNTKLDGNHQTLLYTSLKVIGNNYGFVEIPPGILEKLNGFRDECKEKTRVFLEWNEKAEKEFYEKKDREFKERKDKLSKVIAENPNRIIRHPVFPGLRIRITGELKEEGYLDDRGEFHVLNPEG